jgi:hypothetical protein
MLPNITQGVGMQGILWSDLSKGKQWHLELGMSGVSMGHIG